MESPSIVEQVNELLKEAEIARSANRQEAILIELTEIKQLLNDIKTNTTP